MTFIRKLFADGAMNSDDEDRLLAPNDYRLLLNARNAGAENDDVGAVVKMKGNKITGGVIEPSMKTIGAYNDKKNNRIIYFDWSPSGNHIIYEYNVTTKVTIIILQNSLLNFQKDSYIWHINLIDDDLLFWTDNYNEPREINIQRAKNTTNNSGADQYPSPFIEQYINTIKYPPLCPPTCSYDTNFAKKSNNLRGLLFQAKYKYVYPDGEKSAWSPISKTPLPKGDEYDKIVDLLPIYENNMIKITMNAGDNYVDKIEMAVRIGNLGDFFLAQTFERADYGTSFTYDFYNDEIYTSIELKESNKLFDRVPKQAMTQEFISENKLIYANILEGYDPVDIDIDITPVYSDKAINATQSLVSTQALSSKKIEFSITGIIFLDNVFNLRINVSGGGFFEYIVRSLPGDTPEIIIDKLVAEINDSNAPFTATKTSTTTMEVESGSLISGGIAANPITITIRGLKRGAWHEWGLTYHDHGNRSTSVNKNLTTRKYIDFYIETSEQGVATVDININHTPPIWAKKYQIVYTKNQTTERFIQFTAGTITNVTTSSGKLRMEISLKPILDYKDENGDSILSYDWSKGDRIRFIKNSSGVPYTRLVDVEILSFDIGANEITISKIIPIAITVNCFFEIYTPKKKVEEKFYYEIGECYDILNPGTADRQHQGNFQDQAPLVVVQQQQTITGILNVLFFPNDKDNDRMVVSAGTSTFLTDLIDDGTLIVGTEITISGSSLYDGTFPVIKTRSTTTSNVATSYIKVSFPDPGPGNNGQNNVTFTITTQAVTTGGAAIIQLRNEGDVYYKSRNINGTEHYVEDFNYSDFYISNYINIGRGNIFSEEYKEVRRPATFFVSEFYIPDTNINGLCSFYGYSYPELPARAKDYDQSKGSIQRLYAKEKSLTCYQELKVGRILVSESIVYSQAGVPEIQKSNEILSDMIYYAGEFGIGVYPGSHAIYGHREYFADPNRGAILRLSQDGITPISEYKQHNYFADLFKNKNSMFICAVYDARFGEYVIHINKTISGEFRQISSFSGTIIFYDTVDINDFVAGETVSFCYTGETNVENCVELEIMSVGKKSITVFTGGFLLNENERIKITITLFSETIAFNERKNRWNQKYSYKPEFFVENMTDIGSFKDGRLWLHNEGGYANFYGVQYDAVIEFLINNDPASMKLWQVIEQQTDKSWLMTEATNQLGQKTSLLNGDFENIEGVFWAEILKDENTPVTDPIIEGDDMRSPELKVRLTHKGNVSTKLFSVGFRYEPSERTNK